MRSMLQLLGGVAVAGAVAAGSTAFTASGLTNTWSGSNAKDGFIGGTVAPTVTGANLVDLLFTQAAHATPGVNDVSGATLTFDATTPTGATVTMTSNGSLIGGSTSTGFWCSAVDGSHQSTCVVGTAIATPAAGESYAGISTVTVGVS